MRFSSILAGLALALLATLSPPPAAADSLQRVLDRGELRIGVAAFPPWTFENAKGELVGHEIDIGRRIALDMGVKPSFTLIDWAEIIDKLNKGEIDMIAGGMAITPTRALKVTFSRPYFDSGVSIAANHALTKDMSSVRDLNADAVTLAVVGETLAEEVAARLFPRAKLKRFPDAVAAEAAVLKGDAAAYVASSPEVNFFALQNVGKIDVPLSEPLIASRAGFAVRRGEQTLLNFLNAWIEARDADLWLAAVNERWFQSVDWMKDVKK